MALAEIYNIFFFLKKHANFGIQEMESLYPYELEIFYYMAVKAFKDENGIK